MINGSYNLYLDGKLVSHSKNLITTSGKEVIKQYLAGNIPTWSGAIAVGSIDTATQLSDEYLMFEINRQPTITRSVDPAGNITLRASFPTDLEAVIKEVGVFPFVNTTANGRYQDALITDFSEAGWSTGTTDTNISLVGSSNILLDSTYATRTLTGLSLDLSGYSSTDQFQILVNNPDSNTKTVKLILSDGTNTDELTFSNATSSGVQKLSVNIGTLTVGTITQISLQSTATNKSISLDCLRVVNKDESGYAMKIVSRSVLATPIEKTAGQDLEVEYSLAGL